MFHTLNYTNLESETPNWDSIQVYPIEGEQGDGNPMWTIFNDEHYVRNIAGNEIAIYLNDELQRWNTFANDNCGYIDSEGKAYFYIKDHLGTVRATVDEERELVNAVDVDMWGYQMVNRTTGDSKYEFTSKERDIETGYDYFGARYYLSKIGRWGSIDPLFEKHYDYTPYNYVLNNTLMLIDPDGRQVAAQFFNNLAAEFSAKYLAASITPEAKHWDNYANWSNEEKASYFGMSEEEFNSGKIISDDVMQPADLIGAHFGTTVATKFGGPLSGFMKTNSSNLLNETSQFSFSMSSRIEAKVTNNGITKAIIQNALEKGKVYTGHESGALAFILKEEGKKAVVVGLHTYNKNISTAYFSSKKLNKLVKKHFREIENPIKIPM